MRSYQKIDLFFFLITHVKFHGRNIIFFNLILYSTPRIPFPDFQSRPIFHLKFTLLLYLHSTIGLLHFFFHVCLSLTSITSRVPFSSSTNRAYLPFLYFPSHDPIHLMLNVSSHLFSLTILFSIPPLFHSCSSLFFLNPPF